jgi:hypothetical protein
LQASDGLTESVASRLAVVVLKIIQLQPAKQSLVSNSSRFRGLIDVAMDEKGGDRGLLFSPEFCAVAGQSGITCGQVRSLFPKWGTFDLLVFRSGVMNVIVAGVTAQGEKRK